ncbi:hypothetical protein [Bacillus massiliigorillae]|nr:hypothetical protein [Bacillus massiliigorillae]
MVIAIFMAGRIIDGKNEYTDVVTKRPDLKDGIDAYLFEKGRDDLIVVQ